MGISGLLPLLKSIHKPCSLSKFKGQAIGVDAYGWLHRGTASCAIELALDKPTTKFVDFAMNRVRMLIHFGITPYLVFDGDDLPSKAGTEKERRERRQESKRLGLELLRVGKTSQAHLELQKSVDVTPEMARMLIDELKRNNIQYIVAPYEADSQLAYLERKGIINGILSEDSDLLVFGAKCLITKLDKYGECVEINRNHFAACREVSLVGWSDVEFRRMSMLSGCDYLPGIGSMGLKTAHRMIRKHKTLERLVKAAQFDGKFKVPPGYLEAFDQAERTFLYQWVFCPIAQQLVNLTALDSKLDISDMPFLGEEVSPHVAIGVARGDLHPRTKTPFASRGKPKAEKQPPRPARNSLPNAQNDVQTPATKHSKPIDSFFKPKRTPLAELDPNSFTPSPSQRALLEQSNSSWVAVPAPRSQRSSLPGTAPQPTRRTISDSATGRRSAPNPSKRQRLCSNSELDSGDARDAQVTRSRFFASGKTEASPSLRITKGDRRRSGLEVELYSDDSVEQAMAELVDMDEGASQPKKKLKIFRDDLRSNSLSDSQSTNASRSSTGQSQDTVGSLTPATSFGTPEKEPISSVGIESQMRDFRAKFSFDASGSFSQPAITTPEVQSRKSTMQAKAVLAANRLSDVAGTMQESLNESLPPDTLQHGEDDDIIDHSAFAAMESEVIVAASDADPNSPSKASIKGTEVRGSEDLLVPDSDAESECSPRKPMFSLERFAFAARSGN